MAAALGTLAILAGTAAQASASGPSQTEARQGDPAASPAAYANYLRQSHEEGATDTLTAFQHLTRSEQNKFVGYLHDPALLKTFLDRTTDQGSGISAYSRNSSDSTSLHNGDVTIGQQRSISGLSTTASRPLPRGNHTVSYTTYMKIHGVKIIKLKLWVNFHSNGRDITKANYADAGKKNLSGVISISKGTPKKGLGQWGFCRRGHACTHGHNAVASVVWEGSVGYRGSVWQIDKKQSMTANIYGRLADYSLKNV
ncbi:hypothetical protein ACIHCV_06380 [Streptomyces sp. NPDC051956]|uniref:hypothetical protein n=1 Tax=Streptomyces sp. NPDC051956 TaxID=3365677 RepID=UPI0037D74E44